MYCPRFTAKAECSDKLGLLLALDNRELHFLDRSMGVKAEQCIAILAVDHRPLFSLLEVMSGAIHYNNSNGVAVYYMSGIAVGDYGIT